MRVRLDKLPDRVAQDRQMMLRCRGLEEEFDRYAESLPPSLELEEINWQLEEFRLATFAQQVGTREKVSEKRIRSALRAL
jgi:ATP-dependent helicase HrpA